MIVLWHKNRGYIVFVGFVFTVPKRIHDVDLPPGRDVFVAEDIITRDIVGIREFSDDLGYCVSLSVCETSVFERSDYLYSDRVVIDISPTLPSGYSSMPEYVSILSDLVYVTVRIDDVVT